MLLGILQIAGVCQALERGFEFFCTLFTDLETSNPRPCGNFTCAASRPRGTPARLQESPLTMMLSGRMGFTGHEFLQTRQQLEVCVQTEGLEPWKAGWGRQLAARGVTVPSWQGLQRVRCVGLMRSPCMWIACLRCSPCIRYRAALRRSPQARGRLLRRVPTGARNEP